jgi:hypothetical protein
VSFCPIASLKLGVLDDAMACVCRTPFEGTAPLNPAALQCVSAPIAKIEKRIRR